jgi:FAD dependent oxidoreductase
MGAAYSYICDSLLSIRIAAGILFTLSKDFREALRRTSSDPGLPVPNPTASFWQEDPLYPGLVDTKSDRLPEAVDIVIVGSGITGTSIARSILKECGSTHRVIMLEARQVCSGATGRNGGHIKACPYTDFQQMKRRFGLERARAIINFWVKHLEVLTNLAMTEGVNAECREVETVDLFFHHDVFDEAREAVQSLANDMPDLAAKVHSWGATEARKVSRLRNPLFDTLGMPNTYDSRRSQSVTMSLEPFHIQPGLSGHIAL